MEWSQSLISSKVDPKFCSPANSKCFYDFFYSYLAVLGNT